VFRLEIDREQQFTATADCESFVATWAEPGGGGPDISSDAACGCIACGGLAPVPEYLQPPTSGVAANGLTIFDWDQAAAQLTRSGASWSFSLGGPITVTYGFRSTAPNTMPSDTAGFSRFSEAQIAATETVLRLWSDVANITFVRLGQGGSGEQAYANNASILFANYNSGQDGASAFAYLPSPSATGANQVQGDVWVNISLTSNQDVSFGGFGLHTLSHEIGHALGLRHPSDYDSGSPTYAANAAYWQDARMFTVMSYFGSSNTGGSLNGFAAGPQLHDIAAVQRLYGVNMNTRTEDTIYGFNSNTGLTHYTITAGGSPVFAIWDAGGIDTLDLSGFSTPSEIDLRAEAFSGAGPGNGGNGVAIGNIAIARGVVIENAIGGAGADTIIGNAAANRLAGGADNDAIDGGAGVDTAVFSTTQGGASLARNAQGQWLVTVAGETDTLTGVELADFTDRDMALDNARQTFSGDGTSDILWRNSQTGEVAQWAMAGTTLTSSSVFGGVGLDWTLVGSGDFSGDGRDDLLWRNSQTGVVATWDNGAPQGAGFIGGVPLEWAIAGVGDFNFDGRDDILWRNTTDGSVAIWRMNGTAITGASFLGGAPLAWSIAAVGDFDANGRDEILWRNADGTVAHWATDGTSLTAGSFLFQVGLSWSIVGVGDFNRDGRDEVVWREATGAVAVWRLDGAIYQSTGFIGTAPSAWTIADIGDYNGDGVDDLLWRNTDGSVALWQMDGFTVANAIVFTAVAQTWAIV
jgi:hypothetical protein